MNVDWPEPKEVMIYPEADIHFVIKHGEEIEQARGWNACLEACKLAYSEAQENTKQACDCEIQPCSLHEAQGQGLEPLNEKEIDLTGEFDSRIWAEEFNKVLTKQGIGRLDQAFLVAWFANAIMAGYDNACRKYATPKAGLEPLDKEVLINEISIVLSQLLIEDNPDVNGWTNSMIIADRILYKFGHQSFESKMIEVIEHLRWNKKIFNTPPYPSKGEK